MRTVSIVYVLLSLLTLNCVSADEGTFVPFPVDWHASADSPASVAFLNQRPAGKDGFLRASQGHLVRPDGSRFRIWGLNITAQAIMVPKQDAPQVAAHLARCGINCVRLHFLDRTAPAGLVDAKRDDTRQLDPDQLDKLDFFVAELKKQGVYTDLNLNVGRTYKPGDGARDYELLGFAKALTYFDPRLLELQREYAKQLLTHRNPYTGNEYRREPAVALVEFVNENSLVESWFTGRLLGKNTRKNPGTWTDITASYEQELTGIYNDWLKLHVSAAELAKLRREAGIGGDEVLPRLTPKEFEKASKERFETEARFYMETESNYFRQMAEYLRKDLGVEPLLLGTSDHNHGKSGYPLLSSTSQLDIVDGHIYWQHPNYIEDPKALKRTGFRIGNSPMVNDPLHSTVVQLSRSAFVGKPYTVSEVNHPFPAEYECEGVPILAAYAGLQDWDGVFWYTLAHNPVVDSPQKVSGHFDFGTDPVKMTALAAGALVFLRGDVQPAQKTVDRSYTRDEVIESIRMPSSQSPYFTPGFPVALPLVHGSRIRSLDGPPTQKIEFTESKPLRSDTGELTWRLGGDKQGLVTVETARSEALIGFCRDHRVKLAHLGVEPNLPFCAITLGSLDAQPIANSKKLLLTATARVANTNMRWDEKRKTLEDWGTAPVCIEPVAGQLTLTNLANARHVTAQPLDATGHPLGGPLGAEKTDGGWSVKLGTPATTWYVVTVER